MIPILDRIDVEKKYIQALILVPTRELALQVSSIVKELGKHLGVECIVSTGGTSFKEDVYRLNKTVHVVVGKITLNIIIICIYININICVLLLSYPWKNFRFEF